MAEATMQGDSFGFNILLKDTSKCRQGELGFEQVTFQTLENPLYLLSYTFDMLFGLLPNDNDTYVH